MGFHSATVDSSLNYGFLCSSPFLLSSSLNHRLQFLTPPHPTSGAGNQPKQHPSPGRLLSLTPKSGTALSPTLLWDPGPVSSTVHSPGSLSLSVPEGGIHI